MLMGGRDDRSRGHWKPQALGLSPSSSSYGGGASSCQAFGRWYAPGSTPLPSEDLSAQMYRRASAVLRQHGFGHYEVSNYAKTGRQEVPD